MFGRPLLLVAVFAVLLLSLMSCSQTSSTVTSDFCLIAEPIRYSKSKDTAETVAQVREHNAVWKRLCDGK